MANERRIKRRIKSAKNIAQITRAMQMVAASKMRKAQSAAVSGRPYAEKIKEMVDTFASNIDEAKHPLLGTSTAGTPLVILISTNKGLLGGLNTSLFRALGVWFPEGALDRCSFVTLGSKGEHFLSMFKRKLIADFSLRFPFSDSIPALTTLVTEGYLRHDWNEVFLVYSNFISALRQEPTRKRLLPIAELTHHADRGSAHTPLEFLVEPSLDEILDPLLFHYLENQIRDAILEGEASEHSARMLAMKSATDNAKELVGALTLEYNKARQEKITYEIADMVTARLAVT
ncbi:MAG: ATP synthase F1 subunit gamma [bacterium]|nr:ATP synthase F1 subunit gamma [bacterium]